MVYSEVRAKVALSSRSSSAYGQGLKAYPSASDYPVPYSAVDRAVNVCCGGFWRDDGILRRIDRGLRGSQQAQQMSV